MVKISDELKIVITPELNTSIFTNQLKGLLSGEKTSKLELTVSKINGTTAISNFKKELENSIKNISLGTNVFGGGSGSASSNSVKSQLKQLEAEARKVEAQNNRLFNSYTKLFTAGSLNTKMQRLEGTAKMLPDGEAERVKQSLTEIKSLYDQIQNIAGVDGKNILDFDSSQAKEFESVFKRINTEILKAENASKSGRGISSELSKAAVQGNRLQKIINETTNQMRLNDRAIGTSGYQQWENVVAKARELKAITDQGITVDSASIDKLATSAKEAAAEIVKMGKSGETVGTRLSNQMSKLGIYFSASAIMMGAWRQIKNMVQSVTELDSAMTELKKVTEETDASYAAFLDRAESRAKNLGSTLTDTVRATADFSRLGYELEDAETISDAALVYKNVGDGIEDVNAASESIISSMKAFRVEAQDAMTVVDRFNEVGK